MGPMCDTCMGGNVVRWKQTHFLLLSIRWSREGLFQTGCEDGGPEGRAAKSQETARGESRGKQEKGRTIARVDFELRRLSTRHFTVHYRNPIPRIAIKFRITCHDDLQ